MASSAGDDGLCGLGIFTKAKAKSDATFKDMLDEFTEKCNAVYEGALCENIEKELFDGIVKGDVISANPDVKDQVCEELAALVSAHLEHQHLEKKADSALLQRKTKPDLHLMASSAGDDGLCGLGIFTKAKAKS